MPKLSLHQGTTSKRTRIFVGDSSSTTGAGLTGLTSASSGLTWKYIREDQTTFTTVTAASATAGTFTSGGFVEIGNGIYEIGLPNASLSGGASVQHLLYGATNMVPVGVEIELTQVDNQDAVRMGMTALPNVVQGSAGAIPIGDASGRIDVGKWLGTAPNALSSGRVPADAQAIATSTTAAAGLQTVGGQYSVNGYLAADLISTPNTAAIAAFASGFWDTLTSATRAAGSFGTKIKAWVLGSDNKALISSDSGAIPAVTLATAVTADGKTLLTSGTNANQLATLAGAVSLTPTTIAQLCGYGSNVTYVDQTGGLTALLAATNTATPGAILLGPGTFNLGTNTLSRPAGLSLIGAGPGVTTITGFADEITQGAIVPIPSYSITKGFKTYAYSNSNVLSAYCAPVGWVAPFQPIPTDFILEDVVTDGDAAFDGWLAQVKTTGTPAPVRGIVRRCTFRSAFDAANTFDNSNRAVDLRMDWEDCTFVANTPSGGSDQTRAFVASSGIHNLKRCTFIAISVSPTQSFTYAVNIRNNVATNNVTVNFDQCTAILIGSTAGASADILVGTTASSGTSGMTVTAAGTHFYKPAGGPITVVPLNAAWSTDTSGNALATATNLATAATSAATAATQATTANTYLAANLGVTGTALRLAKGTQLTGLNDIPAGAAMTLTTAYDAAKTAAQPGDVTTATTTINAHTDSAVAQTTADTANLIEMTTGTGTERKFTTTAVSNVAGGSGGGNTTVVVAPLVAQAATTLYTSRSLPQIIAGTAPVTAWTVVDGTGAAVDLSAKTIRFVAYSASASANLDLSRDPLYDSTAALYKYETGSGITIGSGTNTNVVTLQHAATNTAAYTGELRYVLLNATDSQALATGRLPVLPAPTDT